MASCSAGSGKTTIGLGSAGRAKTRTAMEFGVRVRKVIVPDLRWQQTGAVPLPLKLTLILQTCPQPTATDNCYCYGERILKVLEMHCGRRCVDIRAPAQSSFRFGSVHGGGGRQQPRTETQTEQQTERQGRAEEERVTQINAERHAKSAQITSVLRSLRIEERKLVARVAEDVVQLAQYRASPQQAALTRERIVELTCQTAKLHLDRMQARIAFLESHRALIGSDALVHENYKALPIEWDPVVPGSFLEAARKTHQNVPLKDLEERGEACVVC
jgi:hypothetical protein